MGLEIEMRLGARIASLRKAEGMTQEALASAVGVSAAAVSKWENDASYPDIALLCPLARALCTNVDTLLAFEKTLTGAQIGEIIREIVTLARSGDVEGAQNKITRMLRAYPGNCLLRLNLAAAYDVLAMTSPDAPQQEAWQREKRALYEFVHQNGTELERHAAASALATIALAQDQLSDAQRYLDEIPEHHEETIVQRVQLLKRQSETGKAREAVQKKLYAALSKAQMCLMLLCDLQPDTASALCAIDALKMLEDVFGVGGGYSAGMAMEQRLRLGQREKALDCLTRLVRTMTGPVMEPNPSLFSPAVVVQHPRDAAPRELRQSVLKSLETDREFDALRGEKAYQEAVIRLKKSLES